jgi:hypothetical protein
MYAGVSAVVVGNAVKAGVRFTTYDQFKSLLKDEEVGSIERDYKDDAENKAERGL